MGQSVLLKGADGPPLPEDFYGEDLMLEARSGSPVRGAVHLLDLLV